MEYFRLQVNIILLMFLSSDMLIEKTHIQA